MNRHKKQPFRFTFHQMSFRPSWQQPHFSSAVAAMRWQLCVIWFRLSQTGTAHTHTVCKTSDKILWRPLKTHKSKVSLWAYVNITLADEICCDRRVMKDTFIPNHISINNTHTSSVCCLLLKNLWQLPFLIYQLSRWPDLSGPGSGDGHTKGCQKALPQCCSGVFLQIHFIMHL